MLGLTLNHLQAGLRLHEDDGGSGELIVCDNNSTDRTAEIARAAGATVVFEPVNQISRARNRGAAAATGDWLLFVDADSIPSSSLIEEILREIASGTCLGNNSVKKTVKRDVN